MLPSFGYCIGPVSYPIHSFKDKYFLPVIHSSFWCPS